MKALLILNVQNDSIGQEDKHLRLLEIINKVIPKFEMVIFTQKQIPESSIAYSTVAFDNKTFLKGTPGADIHGGIKMQNIKGRFYIFKLGTDPGHAPHTAFQDTGSKSTGLDNFLVRNKVTDLYIAGVNESWEVYNNVIDSTDRGYRAVIINDACSHSVWDDTETLEMCYENKVNIVDSWELDLHETVKDVLI